LPDWFPAGSDPASGVKTNAREAVWTKPQEFKQAADSFAIEAAKMTQLAPAAGIAASRAQGKVLTETCRTCHRNFRSKW
jgi:cytochrome c556